MAAAKSKIISLLSAAGIAFEVTEHQPIYTVEEGETLKSSASSITSPGMWRS